ncbi:MAG: hypothetical protein MUP74_03630, partial [Desulfobacterales bacterium]|nr:hypothetical protein [Desulfobacterales bacterium]
MGVQSLTHKMAGIWNRCRAAAGGRQERRWPRLRQTRVRWGRHLAGVPPGTLVFFPVRDNLLGCGLAGIVAYKAPRLDARAVDLEGPQAAVARMEARGYGWFLKKKLPVADPYLGGAETLRTLWEAVRRYKRIDRVGEVYAREDLQAGIAALIRRLLQIVDTESRFLDDRMGYLSAAEVEIMSQRIELLKDTHWALAQEVAGNIEKVRMLIARPSGEPVAPATVQVFKNINSVLNSLDRLEVRGRDSAGLSLMFAVDAEVYESFSRELAAKGLRDQLEERTRREPLVNQSIRINPSGDDRGQGPIGLALTYKVAAEIGSLGDNVDFLRREIQNDPILQILGALPHRYHTVSAHTRWASVGAISEANCHPLDNHNPVTSEAK